MLYENPSGVLDCFTGAVRVLVFMNICFLYAIVVESMSMIR